MKANVLVGGLVGLATALGVHAADVVVAPEAALCLWYRQPAQQWEEALPLGNGSMGAMVYGGVPSEHIQFNEHTVWTGQPHSYAHDGAVKALPEASHAERRKKAMLAWALEDAAAEDGVGRAELARRIRAD